ncbi:MAG TPA: cation-translocating P-type ATPase [Candidatus Saccharimonadales bacterium]|nr:cation-translocating P-type ATPase [Candidatus Saccharimonadales bacterium]
MDGRTDYSRLTADAALKHVDSSKKGLTLAEAEQRLHDDGPNVLHQPETTNPQKLLRIDPFVLTLVGAAIVTAALQEYVAAFIIVLALYVHGSATWSLLRRHHRFMGHLQRKLTTQSTVLRGGKRVHIDAHELVRGDVVCLEAGELVPADVRIIQAKGLHANQQNLTGDDDTVRKSTTALSTSLPPEQQRNTLYAGSLVTAGEGLGIVVAVGTQTLLAERAQAASALGLLANPLHHPTLQLKQWFVGILSILLIGFGLASWIIGLDAHTGWNLVALLAVAAVPAALMAESLAVVRTNTAPSHHHQAATQHMLRSSLGDSAALAFIVLAGMVSTLWLHVPVALLAVQLIAFELLVQPLPVAALSWDKQPRPLKHPRLHKHLVRELLDASLVAAGLAVANYVFFFARHHVALAYMNTQSGVYLQAATLALVTFALCQRVNVYLVRAHEHDKFFDSFLVQNKRLLGAMISAFIILLGVIYLPWAHHYLQTRSLDWADWATAVSAAVIYLGVRLLQRHTRQHTRHAILDLHKTLGLSHSVK